MRAIDRRLLRHARSSRRFVAWSAALGLCDTLLIVAQAWLIAYVVSGAFLAHRGTTALGSALAALLGVALARAALAWGSELAAVRAASRAKSELRGALVGRGAQLAARGEARTGE